MNLVGSSRRSSARVPPCEVRAGVRRGWRATVGSLGPIAVFVLAAAAPVAHGASPAGLCPLLRGFVASLQPGETREFTYRTRWGSGFKDVAEPAISARRCEHAGYAPAETICAYLMQHGSVEFPGTTVKEAIICLSRGTRFDRGLSFDRGAVTFHYATAGRGAQIDIAFDEDAEVGGMAFRLAASGD